MLQKMAQLSLWKMGIYLIYLTAQILILAALLLTTTNMVVHVIIMLLTILTYFAVSFKNVKQLIFSLEHTLLILYQISKMLTIRAKVRSKMLRMSQNLIAKPKVGKKRMIFLPTVMKINQDARMNQNSWESIN